MCWGGVAPPRRAGQEPLFCLSSSQVPFKGPRKAAPAGQADIFLPARRHMCLGGDKGHTTEYSGSHQGLLPTKVHHPGTACAPGVQEEAGAGEGAAPAAHRLPCSRGLKAPRGGPSPAASGFILPGAQPPGAKPGDATPDEAPGAAGSQLSEGHSLGPGARERGRQERAPRRGSSCPHPREAQAQPPALPGSARRRRMRAPGLGDFGQLRASGDRPSKGLAPRPRGRPLSARRPAACPGPRVPRSGQAPGTGPEARPPGPLPERPNPHLGHLRPEVDVLEIDGAGGEVVKQLAQEDAVAQRLCQVEDHRRGPHDPVVGRQDLTVDEPAAALPPLLHGARGARPPAARWAGAFRAALRPKCGGRGASRPPARGSAAGAGLRAGGPGSPLRRRGSPPLPPPPPPPVPRGPPLPPTCGPGAGAGQRAGPPLTAASPPGPRPGLRAARRRSAPQSAPPGAAFCARSAPRPPQLLPRPRQRPGGSLAPRVRGLGRPRRRRFVRPAFGLSAQRLALGLRGSAAPGRGGRGGAATGGVGAGWGAGPPRAPGAAPAPRHFLPRRSSRKLPPRAGAAAPPGRGSADCVRGAPGLWGSCAPVARKLARGVMARSWSLRPSCVPGGDQEVVLVALGASAPQDRPWTGHRLGRGVPRALCPPSGPRGITRSGRHTARRLSRGPLPSCVRDGDRQKATPPHDDDSTQRPGFPCFVTRRPATHSCPEGRSWRLGWNM